MNPNDMDGDLHEWGDMMVMDVKGLKALGYPVRQPELAAGAGKPPVPDYYPKHQIQALNNEIEGLESKYKNLLILKYALKLDDRMIHKEGLCHYNTVPRWLKDIKQILVKSRYWKR